ncbi:hypothetical protein GCM10025773_00460 [Microbacterium jejuense]
MPAARRRPSRITAAMGAVPEAQAACDHAYFLPPDKLYFAHWGSDADAPLDVVVWARADRTRLRGPRSGLRWPALSRGAGGHGFA